MSAVAVNPELTNALKRCSWGGILPTLAERLALCETENPPYQDVLLLLLSDEISRRDSGATRRCA